MQNRGKSLFRRGVDFYVLFNVEYQIVQCHYSFLRGGQK
jgi:hypothetical protein